MRGPAHRYYKSIICLIFRNEKAMILGEREWKFPLPMSLSFNVYFFKKKNPPLCGTRVRSLIWDPAYSYPPLLADWASNGPQKKAAFRFLWYKIDTLESPAFGAVGIPLERPRFDSQIGSPLTWSYGFRLPLKNRHLT